MRHVVDKKVQALRENSQNSADVVQPYPKEMAAEIVPPSGRQRWRIAIMSFSPSPSRWTDDEINETHLNYDLGDGSNNADQISQSCARAAQIEICNHHGNFVRQRRSPGPMHAAAAYTAAAWENARRARFSLRSTVAGQHHFRRHISLF